MVEDGLQHKVDAALGSHETLGERIRALRKLAGLTQEDVSRAMGLSRSAVAHWETDREGSVRQHLPRLAELLGVPVEAFLNGMAVENVQVELTIDEVDVLRLYRELNVVERLSVQRTIARLLRRRDRTETID
ncbi:transcriptional regulator [Ameyamaea chiangmaiensis NBRC 103196]|uniref:helix-turn-helix domain-containing protein n=1 Tax=Ameyamaea chiangmaiensis TaxID=442969 RepID=UPI002156F37C|nr:helix-turn-helix transcriptional regulator [Ameyamaea chiangmaiensis]GBQ66134.1 transcriptional regulator [Ameyamaea chiangmaiensis NBRC 103196]